jgi:MFS family permease
MTGSMITLVAIPWFVLQTTGSPTKTGITTAVASLPVIIGSAFGGTLVDRFGFRRMSIAADLLSGVSVALIPLLFQTAGLAFWQLQVLVFLRGLLDAPGVTARTSMLPDLAELAGMSRESTNAASQGIQRAAQLVGPAAAGALIAILGPSNVLWCDAASFVASALLVATAVPRRPRAAGEPVALGAPMATGFRSGLQYVWRDRVLLALALCAATSNFFDGLLTVAAPVYASAHLGRAVDLGLMFSAFGAGGLVGVILFGRFGPRLRRRVVFSGGFIGAALAFGVLPFEPGLAATLVGCLAVGIAAGPINPVMLTVFQERTPVDLRGRVFGLLTSISWSAMPLGRVAGGLLIESAGLRLTLTLIAIGYLMPGVAVLLIPLFARIDERYTARI